MAGQRLKLTILPSPSTPNAKFSRNRVTDRRRRGCQESTAAAARVTHTTEKKQTFTRSTKLTAILDDGTGLNHCNGPAFLTCVNPSHNCKEHRQLLPVSLVRCFISDSELYRQDQMFTTFFEEVRG